MCIIWMAIEIEIVLALKVVHNQERVLTSLSLYFTVKRLRKTRVIYLFMLRRRLGGTGEEREAGEQLYSSDLPQNSQSILSLETSGTYIAEGRSLCFLIEIG